MIKPIDLAHLYLEDPDGNVIELVASVLRDWPQAFLRSREEAP